MKKKNGHNSVCKANGRHLKNGIDRIRGWLTADDIEMLEEAAKRPLKHKKSVVRSWKCDSCNYVYFYKTTKCPACESPQVKLLEEKKFEGS